MISALSYRISDWVFTRMTEGQQPDMIIVVCFRHYYNYCFLTGSEEQHNYYCLWFVQCIINHSVIFCLHS